MAEGGEKTEMPTPKKLRDARQKGQVCTSKDVVSTALLIVLLAILGALGVALANETADLIRFIGQRIRDNNLAALREAGRFTLFVICKYSFIFAVAAAVTAIVACPRRRNHAMPPFKPAYRKTPWATNTHKPDSKSVAGRTPAATAASFQTPG